MKQHNFDKHLFIEFPEAYTEDLVNEDISPFQEKDFNIGYEIKEFQLFASLEWIISTSIAVYILKPYFESFLKEMGKDHYQILSNKLKKLSQRGKQIKTTLHTASESTEKLDRSYTQSMSFSVLIQTKKGRFIKLLFDDELDQEDWDSAIDQLLEFVVEFYEKESSSALQKQISGLEKNRAFMIYSKINKESKKIEFYDDKKLISEQMKNKKI